VSAENRNENGEVAKESLVESFNKHYTDYLERYSTNRRVVQPAEVIDEVVSETTTSEITNSVEDEDLFFVPEAVEVVVEPENNDASDNSVPAETPVSTVEPEVAVRETEASEDETPATEAETSAPVEEEVPVPDEEQELIHLGDEEDQTAPVEADNHFLDSEDEDLFFDPEESAQIEEEQDELGFYEPERPASPEPEQPAAEQPKPQIVEREVVREVLVVDREQARDLGYGADRYMDHAPAPAPTMPAPSAPATPYFQPTPAPAPVRTERAVQRNVDVRGEERASRPVQPSRPPEKSSGLFGGLFKRNKDSSDNSVSAYVSDVSEYKERSRIREEGLDTEFFGTGEENNVISLKTQENYDPREERRRLQHIGIEQRPHVDPANWLETTMLDALKMDASDLHIVVDGETKDLRARIRVDGQMQDFDYVTGIPARVIMGRLKAATKLSSGGSFAPEETIYSIDLDGESRKARAVLFRVEDGGEALVMRLPLTGSLRQLDELAFSDDNLQYVLDLLAMPYKLIMIAGPMGSGKTTTAHGALLHVADITRTVWTIEDPVERRLPNLVQLEIDEENGAGFDVLLAKLLRADYNTLFLGEIRDNATAAAAVRQAKAGRQVMSTIHADDNIKSLMRLIELAGDSPMSVLSAVGGVISQRLVRKLNPEWDGQDPSKKYKGRVPIHEILFVNDSIVEVMMQDRPLSEIKQQVRQAKGSTFRDDAVRLINAGVTDRDEVVKVIGEFDADDRY
jgi:type II secretory ATPase GspE/PulE/Tfp pilus assembly ATPase PilB-like protein